MTIVDRYLLKLFVKIFLVCFVSFTGLFVVVHLFSNLDELTALSEARGWPHLMWDFYGPRVAELFDKTAAVWTLVAAVFSVSLMQRRRELTAIEASGVTKFRTLRSIFFCALVIVGLTIANRELVLPKVKDQLVRTPQNWANQANISLGVYYDLESGVKIRGNELSLLENKITDAEVQLPGDARSVPPIEALWATIEKETEQHPPGLLLHQIMKPEASSQRNSVFLEKGPLVFWPGDQDWLEEHQCFVVCKFDGYEAAYGKRLLAYQSFPEMMTELRKPKLWFGNGQQINVHARVMQPLLDLSLLLLGLPLIISRQNKNVFISAGLCFLVVGGVQLATIGCHSLGAYQIIKPAVLAAWLPAILFVPFALVSMRQINR